MRPLHRVRSIKLKLSIVIVAAVAVTAFFSILGYRLGWPLWLRPVAAASFALIMVQFLAHGMTRPLREMERAATALARTDYSQRVHTDSVDEVGRLAEAFNHMAAELEASERLQRDLVANVSHELRTPLGGLQATLENLIDGVTEPTTQTLTDMHTQVDRLSRLVRDLLELSRLESGTLAIDRQPADARDLVARAITETQHLHPAVKIAARIADAPLVAHVDLHRLHQVLINLLDNAVRYAGEHGEIEVTAQQHAERLVIEVADDGPGIAPYDRDRVFERFYRADSARASHDGGAGLGLAIVRWIVELHHGTVHAQANEPHGCRMVIEIPVNTRTGE